MCFIALAVRAWFFNCALLQMTLCSESSEVPLTTVMRRGSKSHHDMSHSILNARLVVILTDGFVPNTRKSCFDSLMI